MAKLTVKVDHPHLGKGEVVGLGVLGAVPNGDSIEVDEEVQDLFKAQHGVTATEFFKKDSTVKISASKGGGD